MRRTKYKRTIGEWSTRLGSIQGLHTDLEQNVMRGQSTCPNGSSETLFETWLDDRDEVAAGLPII